MARKDKYYGTNTSLYGDMFNKIRELGYKDSRSQFRVVCKAKSRAEANRIAEGHGLRKNIFESDYTSETGNDIEIEMADKHGFIVCIDGTVGRNYVSIEKII